MDPFIQIQEFKKQVHKRRSLDLLFNLFIEYHWKFIRSYPFRKGLLAFNAYFCTPYPENPIEKGKGLDLPVASLIIMQHNKKLCKHFKTNKPIFRARNQL